MAKFCSKCGNELKEGARFCSVCGNPVKQVQSAQSEATQQELMKRDKECLHSSRDLLPRICSISRWQDLLHQ